MAPLPIFTGDNYRDRETFYKELLSRIRGSSETHRGWYTHKNPYGCWICDLLLLCETLFNYIDELRNKNSTEDTSTTKS